MKTEDIQIFLGLDVGKTDHWACAVIQDGTKIWNKTLPNDETKLTAVYQKLLAQGQVLVVVDQPATIGALAVAVAQNLGIPVAYLPGLSMRRIADMYPGTAKTDEKDAFIIADEFQNSTTSQMLALLTRIGKESKLVITGDPSQHDRGFEVNGLKDLLQRIRDRPEVGLAADVQVVEFRAEDVQRHPVIKKILKIYS